MAGWIDVARDLIGREGAVVRASLVGVRGSAPREAGAMMLITGRRSGRPSAAARWNSRSWPARAT